MRQVYIEIPCMIFWKLGERHHEIFLKSKVNKNYHKISKIHALIALVLPYYGKISGFYYVFSSLTDLNNLKRTENIEIRISRFWHE